MMILAGVSAVLSGGVRGGQGCAAAALSGPSSVGVVTNEAAAASSSHAVIVVSDGQSKQHQQYEKEADAGLDETPQLD